MVRCVVPSCKNDSRKNNKKNNNVSYHRFPKRRDKIERWKNAIKRPNWEPHSRSYVCSDHFDSSYVSETKKGLRILTEDAVPELCLEAKSNIETSPKLKPKPEEDVTVTANDTPRERVLKRRLKHALDLAKRRRVRCNLLYGQRRRFMKKIEVLKSMMKELYQKQMITKEDSDIEI
uniref:THAP-type domain-containing protein n=1 Tax=Heliothis virescens TaxID=7102 RepID=A0A2A4K5C8_HELVI